MRVMLRRPQPLDWSQVETRMAANAGMKVAITLYHPTRLAQSRIFEVPFSLSFLGPSGGATQ